MSKTTFLPTNPEAMKKFQEAQNTLGGALRQLMHGLLDRENLALAHPVAEQVRRVAGIAELAGMSAGVGERDDRVRICDQLGHFLLVEVHQIGRAHV